MRGGRGEGEVGLFLYTKGGLYPHKCFQTLLKPSYSAQRTLLLCLLASDPMPIGEPEGGESGYRHVGAALWYSYTVFGSGSVSKGRGHVTVEALALQPLECTPPTSTRALSPYL